jgi:hypothetical protein
MYYVFGASGLGITPLTVTSMAERTPTPNIFTQAEYDAFKSWYTTYPNLEVNVSASPLDTLANFNLFYQNYADDATKQWVVDIVTLSLYGKSAIDARGTSSFTMSRDEFDYFLQNNDNPNTQAIRDMTTEISYITNPAFFKLGGILVGTIATGGFNKLDDTVWSQVATDPVLDTLNALDLDGINPYVPSQVVTMEVTIE